MCPHNFLQSQSHLVWILPSTSIVKILGSRPCGRPSIYLQMGYIGCVPPLQSPRHRCGLPCLRCSSVPFRPRRPHLHQPSSFYRMGQFSRPFYSTLEAVADITNQLINHPETPVPIYGPTKHLYHTVTPPHCVIIPALIRRCIR